MDVDRRDQCKAAWNFEREEKTLYELFAGCNWFQLWCTARRCHSQANQWHDSHLSNFSFDSYQLGWLV
jgi:hypothetical protein